MTTTPATLDANASDHEAVNSKQQDKHTQGSNEEKRKKSSANTRHPTSVPVLPGREQLTA